MTFVVTLIALLIERFFDWSHLRRWQWYTEFQRMIMTRFSGYSADIVLALTVLPMLLATFVLQFLLGNALFGFAEVLFQLLVLLYCLGPQNLWVDTFACINALVNGETHKVTEKLKSYFGGSTTQTSSSLSGQILNHLFVAANRRIFAIVFWYMVLGPVGAVFYRLITLSAAPSSQQITSTEYVQRATSIESILDWIPARLFTCLFALGGQFVQVFTCWRKPVVLSPNMNEALLVECGKAALGGEAVETTSDGSAVLKSAIGLLDRAFIITLVMVAMYVLIV